METTVDGDANPESKKKKEDHQDVTARVTGDH
jgi:hypothetical protein